MFREESFRETCILLKAFKKKYHRCPKKNEEFQGEKLGDWVVRTRSKLKRGEYDSVQIEILKEYRVYDLIENIPSKKRTTSYFRSQVALLKKFKRKYNRLPKKIEEYEGVALGVWCNTQKYLFRKGELSKEQIRLLTPTGLLETGSYNFHQRIREVDAFYRKYNRFPMYNEVVNGKALGYWWYCIRDRIWRYMVSEEDIAFIEQNAPYMVQFGRKKDLRNYWVWLNLLDEFQRETGRVYPKSREEYCGEKLGSWCSRQRMRYRKRNLTKNQVEELMKRRLFDDMSAQIEGGEEIVQQKTNFIDASI